MTRATDRHRRRIIALTCTLLGAAVVVRADAPTREALVRRIEAAAATVARSHVAAPDRFEIDAVRFGGADRLAGKTPRLEPAAVRGPNAAGMIQVTFRLLVDDVARGVARATVRGRVLGPALRTTRVLTRGTPLAADDVALEQVDLTRLTAPPLREVAAAIGRVPIRTLGAARILTAPLLAPAPVVRRGGSVELRYEGPALSVVAAGTALRDGVPGEIVPAENRASGVVVRGEVQADGSIKVVR